MENDKSHAAMYNHNAKIKNAFKTNPAGQCKKKVQKYSSRWWYATKAQKVPQPFSFSVGSILPNLSSAAESQVVGK